jgi:chemotaxis signal transduction protein
VSGNSQRERGDRRFLLVRAGGVRYALPAAAVRHVVRGLACHPVPGSQPKLLGLAQFAGEPLAVLDLHALAEGGAAQSAQWVTVILGRGDGESLSALGLAVDEALRVETLDTGAGNDASGPFFEGCACADGGEAKVLNTALLLADRWQAGEHHD